MQKSHVGIGFCVRHDMALVDVDYYYGSYGEAVL